MKKAIPYGLAIKTKRICGSERRLIQRGYAWRDEEQHSKRVNEWEREDSNVRTKIDPQINRSIADRYQIWKKH